MRAIEWEIDPNPDPDPAIDRLLDILDRAGRAADGRCLDCGKHPLGTSCPDSAVEDE